MPLRVRRVRIPVSRFSQLLKNTACLQKPQVFSGFLCVNRPWFWAAPICTLSCNSVQTCTNPCELYCTIRGTSAPLTATFFERFYGSTGLRNRCIAGGQHPPCQPIPSCDRSNIPSPAGCLVGQCFASAATLAWVLHLGGHANCGNYPPFLQKHELHFSLAIIRGRDAPVSDV